MDIRNYFSPLNKKKPVNEPRKEKRKNIIESDEEDPIPSMTKKKIIVLSDSDDDLFEISKPKKKIKTPQKEVPKTTKPSNQSKPLPKPSSPKLKPTSANEFFGSSPVIQSKTSHKRKIEESSSQSDNAFERTLQQLDETRSLKKKKTEELIPIQNEISTKNEEKSQTNGERKGLASKLSEKLKEFKRENKHVSKTKGESMSQVNEEVNNSKKLENVKCTQEGKNKRRERKKTPKKSKEKMYEIEVTPNTERHKVNHEEVALKSDIVTPAKGQAHKKEEATPDEQKKQKAIYYRNFLQRAGPKNPGGKPLPEGKPNCLANLTFVVTGVLETIDRDETAELIKKYGGRVTTSISKVTSYLVIGDDPGQSKTKKAEQLGTKTLDEDGLFNLIKENLKTDKLPATSNNGKRDQQPKMDKKPAISKLEGFHREKSKPEKSLSSQTSPKTKKESSEFSSQSTLSSQTSASCSQKTESLSSQELSSRSSETLMWVDKYKPTSMKNIIGQQGEQSNAKKLFNWLSNWTSNQCGNKKLVKPSPWAKDNTGAYFKAALLSGSPGVGKTTTAHLVSRELGFDVVEMNASDTRSKRALHEEVAELLRTTSLSGFASGKSGKAVSRNHVLLMDEVDGMAGNEDRGGVQELIGLIKGSKVPIICMCNDRNHPKIRSLANYCFDLRFQKPRLEQIKGAMLSICFREGIKIRPEALEQVILGSNQDIRQILHHLSMWSADQKTLDTDMIKKEADLAKKDFKMGPWDVCTSVFSESQHKSMSIHDKVGLFFHDYSIGPLFVQENYLKVSPHCARGDRKKLMEQIVRTASALADSDIIDRVIRRQSAWSLLPTQAIFSSVCPGEYMEGHFSAQVEFPRWLGNNSRKNKFDRISQELHTHMRLKVSGSKQDIAADYCSRLRDCVVEPLCQKGAEGVPDAVNAMVSNDLLREDLDSILELSTWPGVKDKMAGLESKVKAAFTRALNKETQSSPFAFSSITKKVSRAPMDEYGLEEEEEPEEEVDDDDIARDARIKVGKMTQDRHAGKMSEKELGKGKGRGKQTKGSRK